MAIIKKFRIKNFKKPKSFKIRKISVYFGKRKILEDLNLSLNQVKFWIVGSKRRGKSTIFIIIIGLLKPNYGTVFIEKRM